MEIISDIKTKTKTEEKHLTNYNCALLKTGKTAHLKTLPIYWNNLTLVHKNLKQSETCFKLLISHKLAYISALPLKSLLSQLLSVRLLEITNSVDRTVRRDPNVLLSSELNRVRLSD